MRQPGKVTVRAADGVSLAIEPVTRGFSRSVALVINEQRIELLNAEAITKLAAHLTSVAAWMASGTAEKRAVDATRSLADLLHDIAKRGRTRGTP